MRDLIRVLVLGTGQMGSGIARLVLQKHGLELVAAYGKRAERVGMDLGRAIGLDRDIGIEVSADLSTVIEQTRPAVAIQATCSTLTDAMEEISILLRHGVRVISIAEEMAYPAAYSRTIAQQIRRLAVANRAAVIGTGINPGFVLDLLIITLTAVCADVQAIKAKRVNDLSPFGPSVLASQGVGLTPDKFREGVRDGTVLGHVGFAASIQMIAAALGWEIERTEEHREPIVSQTRRDTPFVTIEPGLTAGCLHTAVAYREAKPVITLIHPQQVHPHWERVDTGDMIEIAGTPNVRLAGSPEIPGGAGTVALAVNMIPRVLDAVPGLYCMADLPAPAAMLDDVRNLVKRRIGLA